MKRWLLAYDDYDADDERLRETLCTLGNGYFATRGAAPESTADGVHYPGTYIAGCYDRLSGEVSGRVIDNADLVNVPNWLPLTFRAEGGRWFEVDRAAEEGTLTLYRQELDLRRGVLTRRLRCADEEGRVTTVTQRRIVSMDDPHLAALETTLVPENWEGSLEILSSLDGRVTNSGVERYRDLPSGHLVWDGHEGEPDPHAEILLLQVRTAASSIEIAVAARDQLSVEAERTTRHEPGWKAHVFRLAASRGEPVTIEKVVALHTSRDRAIEECGQAARQRAARAPGFDTLLERHVLAWDRLWQRSQLYVDRPDVQPVLNLHVFHLLQTVSEHTVDLDVGVPARGLHGEAYRGHVFWDELFILPFLSMRFPEIARALLLYRWRRLPEARRAAADAGLRGAMFPWQSAADGREETQRAHLNPRSGRWLPDNSYLQRHVGLAVAHNVWRFYEATGDVEFLAEYGAEIILEIARFFADLATYNKALVRYEIKGVMGPDEYHDRFPGRDEAGLDNNAYTNVLTAWVLRRALEVLDLLPHDRRAELCDRLSLAHEETARFEDMTRKIRVCFHEGVISQFEGYERLKELDWDAYRARYDDIRRLDRILEAEGDSPNEYKLSKQPDVLMLFYVLSQAELSDVLTRLGYPPEADLTLRTIDYYLTRTSHGSTLSSLVNTWLLAHHDGGVAWNAFMETLNSDIADSQHGTTSEGIHLGAMAGTVDVVQRCFAGVSTRHGTLHLDPRLPSELNEVRLGLRFRGHWGVDLTCQTDRLRVRLRSGFASPITIAYQGELITLRPGASWETPLLNGRPLPSPARV